jgi:hypothetical protein
VKWLLTALLLTVWNLSDAQVLTQVYIDPCSGQILTVVIPINNGTVTIVYRGQARLVTANDITSGALTSWINMINAKPCPQQQQQVVQQAVQQAVNQATQQATQQATAQATQAATQAATQQATTQAAASATTSATQAATTAATSAVAAPPPPPPPAPAAPPPAQSSAPAPSSSGGDSGSAPKTETKTETKTESKSETKEESKSESKEEKSESKKEEKKEEKKSSKSNSKTTAKANPIIYSSDLTVLGGVSTDVSAIISLGASQSSLLGNASYGLSTMIWSTFNQFALSGRYTKITPKAIFNYGMTGAYLQGNVITFATAAIIKPIGKGVSGFNYALTYTGELGHGLMAFYTRPFVVSKRLAMSPDIYISNSLTKDLGILTGSGFDIAFTKRFKINCGAKVSLSTNADVPMMFMVMIGTKINL